MEHVHHSLTALPTSEGSQSLSQVKNTSDLLLATVHWNYPVDGRLISSIQNRQDGISRNSSYQCVFKTVELSLIESGWKIHPATFQKWTSQCYVCMGRWNNVWFHGFFVFPNVVTLPPSTPCSASASPHSKHNHRGNASRQEFLIATEKNEF